MDVIFILKIRPNLKIGFSNEEEYIYPNLYLHVETTSTILRLKYIHFLSDCGMNIKDPELVLQNMFAMK